MKKIVLPGLLAGTVNLVLGMMLSYVFVMIPAIATDYQNTDLIRPWSDPLMMLFLAHPFIVGIILAWVWNKSKSLFRGTWMKKGLNFGLAIWIITSIPGMFASYTSMSISFWTVFSWAINGLIGSMVAGLIFAKLNK